MSSFYLGQQLDEKESLEHEFKEFCLKQCILNYYDIGEIENIIHTGVLDRNFNKIIDKNIEVYFMYYIPKYMAAFSNCDVKNGFLSVGINDYGEITGIPYFGDLNKSNLQSYLLKAIKNVRGSNNSKKIKTEYVKHLKVKVINVDTQDSNIILYDNSSQLVDRMKKQKDDYDNEYTTYLKNRKQWMTCFLSYTKNINQLLADKREEIVEFITIHNPDSSSNIIEKIQDTHLVISPDCIEKHKDDKHHHLYWIFRFKDHSVNEFLRVKPVPPMMPKILNAPYTLITHLSNLRAKFVYRNKDIKYYLIQITFSGRIKNMKHIEYYNNFKKTWITKRRVLHPLYGPCCL